MKNTDKVNEVIKSEGNKIELYLNLCDEFEKTATSYIDEAGFIIKKMIEEVSLNYHRAKNNSEEYEVYIHCHKAAGYLDEIEKLLKK